MRFKTGRHFWCIVVINCYASTEEENNDIKCKFYEELEQYMTPNLEIE